MAIINKINNRASIEFGGSTINSNGVNTLLLLAPTISIAVDKLTANIGDILTYTVTINNIGLSEINDLPFTDVLPEGSSYVNKSFSVNGTSANPSVSSNTLSYTIPSIAPLGSANLQFQVKVVGGSL